MPHCLQAALSRYAHSSEESGLRDSRINMSKAGNWVVVVAPSIVKLQKSTANRMTMA